MADRHHSRVENSGTNRHASGHELKENDDTKTTDTKEDDSLETEEPGMETEEPGMEADGGAAGNAAGKEPTQHKETLKGRKRDAENQHNTSTKSLDIEADLHETRKSRIHTVQEILKMNVAAATWLVPGVLFQGFSILAAPEESGKSFLALNTLLALANREPQAGFLYLSLDDRWQRIRPRLSKLVTGTPPCNVRFVSQEDNWPRMNYPSTAGDGLQELIAELRDMDDPRLVVIDTLSLFLPPAKRNITYAEEYDQMTEIRKVAAVFPKLSILAITHTNKGENQHEFEAIYGTRGKGAGSDAQMLLIRDPVQNRATLKIHGNDFADCISVLSWQPDELVWQRESTTAKGESGYEGTNEEIAAQVRETPAQRPGARPDRTEKACSDAKRVLETFGPMVPEDFDTEMGKAGNSDYAIRRAKKRLCLKSVKGHYRLPST